MKLLVTQSCPTLCNPMDCSPPDDSVHGILQARILEWAAISYSKMKQDHHISIFIKKCLDLKPSFKVEYAEVQKPQSLKGEWRL